MCLRCDFRSRKYCLIEIVLLLVVVALCTNGRALDFEPRGSGWEACLGTVLKAKHIYSLKYLLIPRRWWLHLERTDEM